MGIFFSKKKPPSRVTEYDKAILVSFLYLLLFPNQNFTPQNFDLIHKHFTLISN